jgi:hypothetical protein
MHNSGSLSLKFDVIHPSLNVFVQAFRKMLLPVWVPPFGTDMHVHSNLPAMFVQPFIFLVRPPSIYDGSLPETTMASADFLVYRNTESNPRPPPVNALSYGQSLPDLHDKHYGFLLWDVDTLCYLIRLAMPRIRFMFFSTGFCSPASFSAWITPNHLAAC